MSVSENQKTLKKPRNTLKSYTLHLSADNHVISKLISQEPCQLILIITEILSDIVFIICLLSFFYGSVKLI